MKDSRIKIVVVLLLSFSSFLISQNKTPPASQPITVYVFLSETCPICQSYTLTLKQLYEKHKKDNIRFVGVFPNYYATQKGIDEFKSTYSIPFDLMLDKNGALAKHFSASITPEVFVENENKQILYSGRIDDSFYAIGKRRTVITTNDLEYALSAIASHQKIKAHKTQAVGCVITSLK